MEWLILGVIFLLLFARGLYKTGFAAGLALFVMVALCGVFVPPLGIVAGALVVLYGLLPGSKAPQSYSQAGAASGS